MYYIENECIESAEYGAESPQGSYYPNNQESFFYENSATGCDDIGPLESETEDSSQNMVLIDTSQLRKAVTIEEILPCENAGSLQISEQLSNFEDFSSSATSSIYKH